jgi:calcium-dependent protein kinase
MLFSSFKAPFGGCGGPENLAQVRANILNARFRFQPADVWGEVSEDAKDFIRKLLVTDPTKRPTAKECQKSTWLKKMSAASMNIDSSKLSPNVVKALVGFKEYSKMRKLLCEVLSFTLLPDQITHLHKEFERFDTDGSGEISLSGLKRVLMSNAGAGSLGALSEKEVEDIFNAMRVRGTETRIHWHEFIAAMLSQCKVDERNLRLAFDRLDSEHKGRCECSTHYPICSINVSSSYNSTLRFYHLSKSHGYHGP